MASSDKHEKTEKPTAKKKKEARQKGQVSRSQELLSWGAMVAATFLIQFTMHNGIKMWKQIWTQEAAAISAPDAARDMQVLGNGLRGVASVAGPFILGMMLLGVVGNFAQVGLTMKKMKPSFEKMNPKNGIKKLVSTQAAWEAAKQLIKIAVIGLIAWKAMAGVMPVLVGSGPMSVTATAATVGGRALSLVRTVSAGAMVLAAADYGIQRRRTKKSMMMTKHQVKEEGRMNEGNPEMKGAIRRRQRKMSRLRMMAAVASADAIVVNPTHVAVAIKYEPGKGAPRVVAKGADNVAARIKAEAAVHSVLVVEDRGLARALYAACDLEDEIPIELYEAVARLLTFIFSLKATGTTRRIDGGAHHPPRPLFVESH